MLNILKFLLFLFENQKTHQYIPLEIIVPVEKLNSEVLLKKPKLVHIILKLFFRTVTVGSKKKASWRVRRIR